MQKQPKTRFHIEAEKRGMSLRTLAQVKEGLVRAKSKDDKEALARLMLRHGRLTDEALSWLGDNYQVWD